MTLIDKDALLYDEIKDEDGYLYMIVHAPQIDNAPAIDAVEVVRCKDCAWFHSKGDGCPCGYGTCSMFDAEIMSEDFYCADGHKKDVM